MSSTATTITIAALPAIGAALAGGTFADLTWQQAGEWAAEQGGLLPTRPVAALLFANVKAQLQPEWHWTADEHSASYAWDCTFSDGNQFSLRKSYEGSAVAVRRLIP